MNTPKIKISQQYDYNVKQVLFATQMTQEELGHLIHETADTWLRRFFNGKIDHDAMLQSDAFRKWWRMHWLDRDDRCILDFIWEEPEDYRFAKYRSLHQIVFYLLNPIAQHLYQDFLDMQHHFEHGPVSAR